MQPPRWRTWKYWANQLLFLYIMTKMLTVASLTTRACKHAEAPTLPGGHKQPGMQARLTQGRSRFWHVLAHSRPLLPCLQSSRTSGGGHWADRRSRHIKLIPNELWSIPRGFPNIISKMTKLNKNVMLSHLNVCTSGWGGIVVIIEEVWEKWGRFRGAAAHRAILTVATYTERGGIKQL